MKISNIILTGILLASTPMICQSTQKPTKKYKKHHSKGKRAQNVIQKDTLCHLRDEIPLDTFRKAPIPKTDFICEGCGRG